MEDSDKSKWDIWNKPLNRTFFIAVAASSILGIGIWIGKTIVKNEIGKNNTELMYVMEYIKEQEIKVDSLKNLTTIVDSKYLKLDDYNEDLKIDCKLQGNRTEVKLVTPVFSFLGEGIYQYQLIVEKFVNGKYQVHSVGGDKFHDQKKGNQVLSLVYVLGHDFKEREKYRVKLDIGSYKKLYGEFTCY